MELTNEFNPIRDWASERGIFKKGDKKTQMIKLVEEVGELSQAILENDQLEFEDAIGDCVVVLTNLAKLGNTSIENCINNSYAEIANRKGKMENGTFVRESN
jgi:NTP pyrophosphatase (non-canonical NTP hydrolase)